MKSNRLASKKSPLGRLPSALPADESRKSTGSSTPREEASDRARSDSSDDETSSDTASTGTSSSGDASSEGSSAGTFSESSDSSSGYEDEEEDGEGEDDTEWLGGFAQGGLFLGNLVNGYQQPHQTGGSRKDSPSPDGSAEPSRLPGLEPEAVETKDESNIRVLFIQMEFCEGNTLRELIDEVRVCATLQMDAALQ